MRAPDGSKIKTSVSEASVRPPGMLSLWLALLTHIATQTVLTEGITHLRRPTLPHHPPYPLPPAHPLICATHDITAAVKKLLKIQ